MMAAAVPSGSAVHARVEPSTSVRRNVTVPVGIDGGSGLMFTSGPVGRRTAWQTRPLSGSVHCLVATSAVRRMFGRRGSPMLTTSDQFGPVEGGSMRLDGQAAVVTGASRGIGLAIAHELAAHGCRVAMAARSRPEIDR